MRAFKTAAIAALLCATSLAFAQDKPGTIPSCPISTGFTTQAATPSPPVECVPALTESECKAEAKLTMLVTLTFKETPCTEALAALAKQVDVPIRFPLLESIGSDGEELSSFKVSLTLQEVPLKTAVQRVIQSAFADDLGDWLESGAQVTLAPTMNGLVIEIGGMPTGAYTQPMTRIYPVKDICPLREDAEDVIELIHSSTGTVWKDTSSDGQPAIRYMGMLMKTGSDDEVLQLARHAGSVTYLQSIPGFVVKTDPATHYEVLSLLRMIREARLAATTPATLSFQESHGQRHETELPACRHPGSCLAPGLAAGQIQVQVLFAKPEDMHVTALSQANGESQTPLVVPGRQNYCSGHHPLKVSNVPGRKGVVLFPTLDIREATKSTQAYLNHNAISIQLTEEDLDAVANDQLVTKVIYLPDPGSQDRALADAETLVSTRLDPGVDPIAEADQRGEIVAVLELGSRKRATTPDAAEEISQSHEYSNSYHVFTNAYSTTREGVTKLPSLADWEALARDGGGSDPKDPRIMLRLHDHQLNFLPITAQLDLATAQTLFADLGRMIVSRVRSHGNLAESTTIEQPQATRESRLHQEQDAQVYPYYTSPGPRDFLQNAPRIDRQ